MFTRFGLISCGLLFATCALTAQEYQRPPAELAQLVDAVLTPAASLSPDNSTLLQLDRPSHPSISELAEPELRLAGLRISPRNSGPSRATTWDNLRLIDIGTADARVVSGLPAAPRVRNASWSPDSRHVAFTLDTPDAVELWVLSRLDATARRLGNRPVNDAMSGRAIYWLDPATIVTRLVPADRGETPKDIGIPAGPVIQQNIGKTAPARTYQDLLQNPHDERLFDHFATSQLATVALDGSIRDIGQPRVIAGFEPSPDGRFMLLESLHRPYSYLVPQFRFPRKVEIVDRSGRSISVIAQNPLQEEIPLGFGSVPTGRRSFEWRADQPATVFWVEALDDGDARKESEWRDRLFTLASPFDGAPQPLATLPLRFRSIVWGDDNLALVAERWWTNRKARIYAIDPSAAGDTAASRVRLLVRGSLQRSGHAAHSGEPVWT